MKKMAESKVTFVVDNGWPVARFFIVLPDAKCWMRPNEIKMMKAVPSRTQSHLHGTISQ